ncbi:gephyrin-like molybdotransferase Glp [Corynebacterium pelargi]|uniref:Molybdopterin molybdenumtransferase n=1 Tax=Corynebacterium pelargi TaxID=1471400 RepID=A0A410W9G8_9CORY|nr:gephyrin-like molybdotransferase Glp [Corynebacterium pelargi]QAU52589.1 Molybdopterin molybdenumtransferase [Corynebacterium pelargi]GGG77498.1 molybdopterin molybdenumtransferase MoeA [Corynebacterium pelargi]
MSCEHSSFDRSVDEHRAAIIDGLQPLPTQHIPVAAAAGRVLASDVQAQLAVPPFSNSAMDGFLVHRGDLRGEAPWEFPVIADVPAGAVAPDFGRGEALRIMTGAACGEQCEDYVVIPVEDTDAYPAQREVPTTVQVRAANPERSHIRRRGEDAAIGEVVLEAGTELDAGAIAALTSIGVVEVEVHALPMVCVLSSGDELAAAGTLPGPGQIPDSNRPMIAEACRRLGINVTQRHVPDDPAAFEQALQEATASADVVITTGGVSAGAFDVVKEVLGSSMWFGHVAMQPGKPQGAGIHQAGNRQAVVLCLPGNPVSAYVSFFLFAQPVLRRLSGFDAQRCLELVQVQARSATALPANGSREQFIPTSLEMRDQLEATPRLAQGVGSHRVASLAHVRGMIRRAPDHPAVEAGDSVDVILF